MNKFSTLILLLAILPFSCKNPKKKDTPTTSNAVQANWHPGEKLMETHCYTCHNPSTKKEDRMAPPMADIKKYYRNSSSSKKAFIKSVQTWIKNPDITSAKMPEAIKRFGLMPKQDYPEETIAQIADFIYDYDFEQPEVKGYSNEQNAPQQKLPYAEHGLKYALSTKAVLGKNLMRTIQKKGTIQALSFCNERAYPLTDSMATVHHVSIKRISDNPRNPNNKANTEELKYINTIKKVIANNLKPHAIVKETDSTANVYYPIITNAMCLQCHGKPEAIEKSTLNKIKALYPNDKAIGYDINQVRGIWRITFSK